MTKRIRLNQFYTAKFAEGDVVDTEKFKETIRKAEGLRLEPYKDTKDYDTVGYGHLLVDGRTGNISVDRIDKKDAEKLLQQDIQIRLKEVNALLPDFKNFPEDAQQAIFSEYYRGSIGQSDVTRALINKRRYKDAAKEFLNNDEYKEAKKNGKLGGITKRFEAVSEALMKMAQEKKERIILPIRKPSKEEMDRFGFSTGGDVKNDKAKDPAQIARGPEVSGVPRYFGKGEHKVQLAYITDPEAELLKKLDLHDSNPPHTGPSIKNIPNYNDFGSDGKGGTTGGGGGDRREGGTGGDGNAGGEGRGAKERAEQRAREEAAATAREQARIASAVEAAKAAEKARAEEANRKAEADKLAAEIAAEKAAVDAARKKAEDEAAANAREQARIDSALAAAKAADKAKEDRKKRREEGSTFSQVEQTFGPAFSSGSYGFGIYADPTSSTYNPKFNEHYGSGYSSLNYSDTQSILDGKYSSDDFTNQISIVDDIKNKIKDYTTFGDLELQKFEGEGQGLQVKYNFKKGGLLDRSYKKKK